MGTPGTLFIEGGDHAVLLLHGLSSSPLEMRFLARYLNGEGFTICSPVLDGYSAGTTEQPMEQWIDRGYSGIRHARSALCTRVGLRTVDWRRARTCCRATPPCDTVTDAAVADAFL